MKSGQPPSTTTTRVAQVSTIYRHWADKKPPVYHIPPYYYEIRADYIGGNRSCPVNEDRREVAYHLLRYWIELTNKHNIVWWITFGTLLGAIRENDFIPYDTDVDVEVLGDYEHIVRSLAVKRGEINPNRINLITRIGSACQHDGGLKYDCEGHWQTQQTDRCAICYPLGRLFHGEKGYIDIYSSVIRAVPFANPLNPNHIEFNVEQQGSGHRDEKPWLVRMREIFPLSTCVYMGLKVPCPRDAHSVLTKFYGKDYRKPSRFCNSVTGGWS
ncbi:hypothetical protein D915_005637 [Fasciola hepatica]|uniref:LicD/FKTN/FKRP nucleotidyltransferase domain-containing protein n=1 Tax=Fasciola hepatica TaxID=6192 RepID=A0A4E0R7J0_FASHE|nr:hypothetical protein D915_005637 [Fasciola hepatica]